MKQMDPAVSPSNCFTTSQKTQKCMTSKKTLVRLVLPLSYLKPEQTEFDLISKADDNNDDSEYYMNLVSFSKCQN